MCKVEHIIYLDPYSWTCASSRSPTQQHSQTVWCVFQTYSGVRSPPSGTMRQGLHLDWASYSSWGRIEVCYQILQKQGHSKSKPFNLMINPIKDIFRNHLHQYMQYIARGHPYNKTGKYNLLINIHTVPILSPNTRSLSDNDHRHAILAHALTVSFNPSFQWLF